ncbi:MAG: hypothetical protein L6V93_10240 [Clostridiales bacterium]|nr:MAG: hypothetical protein L6V93_10240 [Clostridiales bacterium]
MMYCVYNTLNECVLYIRRFIRYINSFTAFCAKKETRRNRTYQKNGIFEAWTPFEEIVALAPDLISTAVKMGEGWLLTAEMLELGKSGCTNIVCTQPFGCLPNHICGKRYDETD